MIKYGAGVLAVILAAGMARPEDPRPPSPEPPVRLKKKERPKEPEPAIPKKTEPKKPQEKPAPMDDAIPEEKSAEILARIGKNLRDCDGRLAQKDVGDATQQLQRDIIKDLDSLIEQAQRQNQNQQNSRDDSGISQAQSREQRTLQQRSQSTQQQASQRNRQTVAGPPRQGQSGAMGGRGQRDGVSRIVDLFQDFWGQLPQTTRQEMDQYAREKFMPKYHDMLKQYYSTIAEKGRRSRD